MELARKCLNFDKPIIVGFSVLELSKYHMYDFHYRVMKQQYPDQGKLTLCYMDTDSFIYLIKTPDFYEDMKPLIHGNYPPKDIRTFDTSNYKPDNPYGYSLINKKVLGAMKDETGGKPMKVFCGLRAKTYIYDIENGGVSRRAKGIKRNFAGELLIDAYKQCVEDRQKKIKKFMVVFKSYMHQIYTERLLKCALNGSDDKRLIRHDGISSYAYGHKDIEMEILERDFIEELNDYEDSDESQNELGLNYLNELNETVNQLNQHLNEL